MCAIICDGRRRILTVLIFNSIILCCNKSATEVDTDAGEWTNVESDVTASLYDIDFSDEKNGWIVGDSGLILHSNNGGVTWKEQTSPTDEFLMAVDFIDSTTGWICGQSSIIHTMNGGDTWAINYTEDLEDGHFRNILFLDNNTGWAVGGRGYLGSTGILMKTENGGETWHHTSNNELPTLTDISIVDNHSIWICGFGGTVLTSTDLGLTWTKKNLNISPAPSLTTIQFVDQYNGWTSSRDDWFGFFRTTDGGKTWIQRSEESLSIFGVQTFFFIDALNGWLATFPGRGYTIAETTDGGQNWEFQPDMGISRIHSFCFLDKDKGWAVGLEGVILSYRNN